jgi:hypothetical protein
MAARVSEAVAIRDDEEGVELRVSRATVDGKAGLRVELTIDDERRTVELDAETSRELRLGIERALKAPEPSSEVKP